MNYRLISFGLATHTGADAKERLTSSFGNAVAAIFAVIAPLPSRHAGPGGADRVVDGIIDLILHRTVA